MRYRVAALGIALVAVACEEVEERPVPPMILSPETLTPQLSGPTGGDPTPGPLDGDGEPPPPPWPVMAVVTGRFSAEFAREYVQLVDSERAAFDAEMGRPKDPPRSPQEAAHRRISEKGRRQRLMNQPQLAGMTDEEISDILSFNPDLPSGEREFDRLLSSHPGTLSICVDHGRWLLFKKRRDDAIAEYQRCARTPGISEDQLRYVQTAIAGAKNVKD